MILGRDDTYGTELVGDLSAQLTARGATVDTILYPARRVEFGEEAETVVPGVVQVTDTRSVSLSGLHWTSTAWGFAWEAGWYEQGDLYDRLRIRVGLEHRF